MIMKIQICDRNSKKPLGFVLGLMLLPLFAACQPDIAQTPPATTPPPATDTPATPTPAPTTGATTDDDVVDVVDDSPSLKTFSELIDEADLGDQLEETGPYTLFAPSDQAFAALPEATRQRLLQPENRETLRQILTTHVVSGNTNFIKCCYN
jgi:uncharacterized surface protein with fasciclin (FAS1) repeats